MICNLLNMACQLLTNLKKVLHRRRDGNSDPSAILSFFCTEETLLIFRLGATSSQIKTGATDGNARGTYNRVQKPSCTQSSIAHITDAKL